MGAGLGALFGDLRDNSIDQAFQQQVRDHLQPGTSALFMMIQHVTPDKGDRCARTVRRHRDQDLAVQGRRAGAPGRAARRRRRLITQSCRLVRLEPTKRKVMTRAFWPG